MSAPKRRPRLSLQLYVAGNAPKSLRAIENLRSICEANFANDYEIEIVDLLLVPARALRRHSGDADACAAESTTYETPHR